MLVNFFCSLTHLFSFFSLLFFAARKPFRPSNSKFLAGVGLVGGVLYGVMRSTQRLAGLEPNDSEVAKYGALTSAQLASRVAKMNVPNGGLVDSKQE